MSIFTPDTSIQITGDSSLPKTYNTKDNPNLAFHSRAGIYNSANNEIKFFTNNIDALTIDANQKVICNGSLITNIAWGNIDGKPSFFDGTWTSLSGKPTLFDGTWTSLSGKPTLFDGTWTSLSGKPTLATVATSGLYNDLSGKPTLFDGTWTSLSGKPTLATVATSGLYNDLSGKPTLFDGTWTSLSGKPTLFDGTWTSLSGKPTLFDGTWTSLSGKPTLFDGTWTSLSGKPTIPDGNYNSLTNKPFINSGTDVYNANAGNVGIGTITPLYKLDVHGETYLNSNVAIGHTPFNFISSYTGATLNPVQSSKEFYLSFTSSGTLVLNESCSCDILVVGGGGGGATGGGGAGGFVYLQNQVLNAGSYSIQVGAGGQGVINIGPSGLRGNDGQDSYIMLGSTYIARGFKGGGGAGYNNAASTPNGTVGSGGGNGMEYGNNGLSLDNPVIDLNGGNKGGRTGLPVSGRTYYKSGGGGGGAGGVGGDGIPGSEALANSGGLGGAGGIGLQCAITGINTYYAGGGAGGTNINSSTNSQTIPPQGGLGGGGNGNLVHQGAGTNATANTGGGGGGSDMETTTKSGNGGSGIVIIRIKESNYLSIKTILNDINTGLILNTNDTTNKNQLRVYPYSAGINKGYAFRVIDSVAGVNNDIMYICANGSSGNVGIGSTIPAFKLDVAGDVNITGNYKVNGVNFTGSKWTTTGNNIYYSTGNVGINVSAPNSYAKLQVNGVVNFHNGNPSAVPNNYMSSGSLIIGGIDVNYGNGSGWNTNTAGLLLECANNTEIAVHDASERVASLINYVGGGNNYHEYGRNMGWGHPLAHYFRCNQTFECFFNNAASGWQYFKVEPTSLWGDGLSTASDQNGTKYLTMRNLMFQAPHITPASVGGNAYIRLGRAGGVSSGNWWEVATRTDGRFHIVLNGNTFNTSLVIKPNGNASFGNQNSYDDPTAPTLYQFLHLGNSATANVCDWNLVIHKSNGSGSTRHFAMGYDNSFYETIGDNGANNTGSGSWMSHLSMSYAAPDYALQLFTNGNFQVYGTISSSSDIKIKKNVRTIDNALWKVQQLRGVYYTHIIEGTKNIGLIAQEVEGIIPEVVSYNERTDMKGVNYANLTALLINAVKEQQEIIEAQNERINKIEELLYNLISKEDAI